MDQVRKKDAIEAEWLRNYQLIRNLYLSDMSLNDLVYWLGIFESFTVTKSQLEYRLKKWKISKKVDCHSWKYIDQAINKRKLEGKESDVLLSGKRLKQSTIEKETHRHRDTSIRAQNLPGSDVQSIPSSDQIIICTPQAYTNDFEWPETLPWFKLRSKFQEWLSYTQLHKMTIEQKGLVLDLPTPSIFLFGHEFEFDQSQASQLIPRLARNLATEMPEYFPGEHLQTAQIIATGTTNVMIPECLKLIFYQFSNNMVSEWESDDFENLYTMISKTGLLDATDSLRRARQQDLTIRAFMDNLFRELIQFILYEKNMMNIENPNILIKWLLSLGQDPNIPTITKTALENALLSRQIDIIEPLLNAGAVTGRERRSSHPRSILSVVLPDRICDSEGAHIIRLLLGHDKLWSAEEMVHAAILLQDERLFEQALDNGADLSFPIEMMTAGYVSRGRYKVIREETALSTATAVSVHATSVVLGLLQNRNQGVEAASFITPDVFISAAYTGHADIISFLHEINPIGFRRNVRGVTPLEVAIEQGHQEAYQLLFQLYRQSSATLLLIPILTDQLDILQYFLANGLCINLTTKEVDINACKLLVPNGLEIFHSYYGPLTVLELLLQDIPVTESWKNGVELLVRSGAFVPAEAILELLSAGHDDMLSAVLDKGVGRNVQNVFEDSGLALGQRSKTTNSVRPLQERGAELQPSTSEVFQALVPKHVCNIQGERGRCGSRLRALILEHWASFFNTSKDSVLEIDAAIITQHDSRLRNAFSELPTYYSPSSLCCAVLVENHWAIDFLVKNRCRHAPHNILEGTAVGLAAMLGNLPLVRKLVSLLQKPEIALLPFFAYPYPPFIFSRYTGLDINSSHIFWHNHRSDYDGFGGYTRRSLSEGSPLALAASYQGTAGILELLSHGYQPDDVTWARALSAGTPNCLKALMDYNLQVKSLQLPLLTLSPLLRYAIQHEMEAVVIWLIDSGADIDENDVFGPLGRSPVQLAIELGHLTIAERLLRSGLNVNAAPSFFGGVTTLQCAAIKGHLGLAKQLLDAGARVNSRGSREDGRTALEGAAEHGRLDMVGLLLYHRALTIGPGRFQFLRAICFAELEGHHATALLLRQSRQWTDEDSHIYDSMCAECNYYFSEPRRSGERCHACNGGHTPGQYCCDEIHMPEDDCYHSYTEDEERRYELYIQQEESESGGNIASEEGVGLANDDRWDTCSEDFFSSYTYL